MKHRNGQATLFVAGILLAAFLVALGLTVRRLRESRRVRPVPILMYHKIGDVDHNAWWVPTDVFERQMRALRNAGYTSVLPGNLADHRRAGTLLPPKPVVITFDDGYRDSLRRAEPILKACGFRAVVYLITDRVADTPDAPLQYEGQDCLTWPEVAAMRRRGTFVFGGHAHRHENLAVQDDPGPNIRECFRQLRAHGIRRPAGFCYPHGERNAHTVAAVRRAGFRTAVVCEDRVALTGRAMPLLELPRVSVMGGRHGFRLDRAADGAAAPTAWRLLHDGIPIEIVPRWTWPGAAAGEGWLPGCGIGPDAAPLAGPPPGAAAPARLEVWDKHRLFLLAVLHPPA